MSEVLVRCQDAGRTHGSGPTAVVALYGATCQIRPGDRVALIGPSGSGKSTLVYLLAGLDLPTAGSVTWPALGPIATLRPGPVSVIFQGPSLIAPLDVTENVALPLVLAGAREEEARSAALAALARLGLEALSARLPEELSGGQAQRVAIARGLAGSPRLILADEPTGQLDRATAAGVIDVLMEAADAAGAALVVSTHDISVAERLALHWQLSDGQLLLPALSEERS